MIEMITERIEHTCCLPVREGKELEKESISFSINLPITIQNIPIWINFLRMWELTNSRSLFVENLIGAKFLNKIPYLRHSGNFALRQFHG
jgi:hypothetical protein